MTSRFIQAPFYIIPIQHINYDVITQKCQATYISANSEIIEICWDNQLNCPIVIRDNESYHIQMMNYDTHNITLKETFRAMNLTQYFNDLVFSLSWQSRNIDNILDTPVKELPLTQLTIQHINDVFQQPRYLQEVVIYS
jgi:hypothetical protein